MGSSYADSIKVGRIVGASETSVVRRKRLDQQSGFKTWTCVAIFLSIWCISPITFAQGSGHNTSTTKYFDLNISLVNFTRNCVKKALLAVNGQFPGPLIHVNEGDRVVVNVTNNGNFNVTIHWHGLRQRLTNWQDGVGYITQCSIQPGDYFLYDFVVTDQRGTTFWHAHVNWVRGTVHGAFITAATDYPYPKPFDEIPVILGEWWNGDIQTIEETALAAGGSFPLADALTIDGYPGSNYNCSESEGIATYSLVPGKTYLLRIINAALNTEMFFSIANHSLTVVEADSNYVKPIRGLESIYIAPGQTVNALLTADQPAGTYYIAARAHSSLDVTDPSQIPAVALPFVLDDVPVIAATALLNYAGSPIPKNESLIPYPALPPINDTAYRTYFDNLLKSLTPENVPKNNNTHKLLFTVGTGTQPCTAARPCSPQVGAYRVVAEVNNITFQLPTIAILQAFYYGIPGVYRADFPPFPPVVYDFTNPGSPPNPDQVTSTATRVTSLEYGETVDLVLQDINNFAFESHPFHLHGFFFYVLGRGSGNFNPRHDPKNFNYYDPPARFTIDVPARGWVAIRFLADNPGAWLLHCHLDKHTSYGMMTAFIVKSGIGPDQTLAHPPSRLTPC